MQTLYSCVFVGGDFIFVFGSFLRGKMLKKLKTLTVYLRCFLRLASKSKFCFLPPQANMSLGDGFRVCTAPYFPTQGKWLVSCAQRGLENIFCDLSAAESLGFQRKWRPPAPHRKQSSSRP